MIFSSTPSQMISDWWIAFMLTQLIEIPCYRVAFTQSRQRSHSTYDVNITHKTREIEGEIDGVRLFLFCLIPTSVTHPLIWWVFPPLCRQLGLSYFTYVMIAEGFVILVEALVLWSFWCPQPIKWSLIAYGLSMTVGYFILYCVHLFDF